MRPIWNWQPFPELVQMSPGSKLGLGLTSAGSIFPFCRNVYLNLEHLSHWLLCTAFSCHFRTWSYELYTGIY